MDLFIVKVRKPLSDQLLQITGSKSESNRLLILQQLFPDLVIKNLSSSDDTTYLAQILKSDREILDIGHAGTAMRFGTAYFSGLDGVVKILQGSQRMHERPIGILVDALRELGADISYLGNEGFPPLKISGKKLTGGTIKIDGSVSSQFLTALLLIAPSFDNGISLHITNLTSIPYLKMTFEMLRELGMKCTWETQGNSIVIGVDKTTSLENNRATVESDWSSAGYWYSWVALQKVGYCCDLSHYREDSLQGDSRLKEIYEKFGVKTTFSQDSMRLEKVSGDIAREVAMDLRDVPDQAQTIFATCLGLGVDVEILGLHTLKIKETDRIEAMKMVGSRFRESKIITTDHSIKLVLDRSKEFNQEVIVDTLHDHRMAMAFAPLCMKASLIIKDAGVVSKSYGDYWNDLRSLT
jgi:3-phosphoshikimate 1-carboxyvinyltransferase